MELGARLRDSAANDRSGLHRTWGRLRPRRTKLEENRLVLAPEQIATAAMPPRARDASDELVRIARAEWRAMAITLAAAIIAAAIFAATLPKRYRATAIGVVAPLANTLTPSEAFHGVEALDRRSVVATVAALPATDSSPQHDYDISAVVLPNTNLVRIDVDAHSPEVAAAVA